MSLWRRIKTRPSSTLILCLQVFIFFLMVLWLSQYNLNCETSTKDSSVFSSGKGRRNDKKLSAFLVVLIMTATQSVDRRLSIRETWLKNVNLPVLARFVIGTKSLSESETAALENERAKYGDLLLLPDLHDSYNTLTLKLLMMYQWLDANVDYSYVLKADDDTFARLDAIVEELRNGGSQPQQRFYWGYFDGRATPKIRGKWVEADWLLCDHYLPYALGGGYLLSADLVHFVAANSEYLKLYGSEDVSLGAWMASVDVTRVHDPRFDTEYKSRGCRNTYLVTHKQSPEEMYAKQEELDASGRLCALEVQKRSSYNYNWKVPPSQCCMREKGIP